MAQYASTLDVDGTVKIAPDLVWLVDGKVRACLDVKYKVEKRGRYPNADLDQMAADCRRFEVREGWSYTLPIPPKHYIAALQLGQ